MATKQTKVRYRDHDLHKDDIPEIDYIWLNSNAVKNFVYTAENNTTKIVVSTFMDYLTSKGFRIVKVPDDKKD